MEYNKTNWVDHVTLIDAKRMNNLEEGVYNAVKAIEDVQVNKTNKWITSAKDIPEGDPAPAGASPNDLILDASGNVYQVDDDKKCVLVVTLAGKTPKFEIRDNGHLFAIYTY